MRRALLVFAASALAAVSLAACGSSGGSAPAPVLDKAGDAELLNGILTRQMAVIGAYDNSLPALRGAALASAREFRAQEQEHANAVIKALRGLGAEAAPISEEIDIGDPKTQADFLAFLYEVEAVSIDHDLSVISHLSYPWPRSLLGSIAANQAQHLVVLRSELGARAGDLIPEAFENGTAPAPSGMMAE
jgi:hypothetical protein